MRTVRQDLLLRGVTEMLEKDIEIVSLWKTLTESEKKKVLRQIHEKLTPCCHIKTISIFSQRAK